MGSNISARVRPRGAHTREVLDGIRRIVQALRESSRLAESRVGLSGARLFVLRAVAESPGLSMNDLAERTRTHQSSVSAVVAGLARAGLVQKTTAAGDARRAEIRLSAKGRRRLGGAPETAQERLVGAVDALPVEERIHLATLLNGLVRRMSLPRAKPSMFFEESRRARRTARTARRAARG